MSEGVMGHERSPNKSATEGSFEGNVRMPQTYLAISLFGLDAAFKNSDPKRELEKLVEPIPIDERMIEKTKKANAQHSMHQINVVLTPERVRNIELSGNLTTLYLLEKALLKYEIPFPTQSHKLDADGAWATQEEQALAQDCLEELTPERTVWMRALITAATDALRKPTVAKMLRNRKAQYKDWANLPPEERDVKVSKTKEQAQEAFDAVHDAVEKCMSNRELSHDEQVMASGFLDGLTLLFGVTTV